MTDLIIRIVFSAAGALLGFLIPGFAYNIARYKHGRKGTENFRDKRYTSPLLKVLLCIINTLVWTLADFQSERLMTAFLLSVLFSTALMISLIDFQIRIIPNELVLVLLIAGLALQAVRFGFSALIPSGLCLAAMMVLFAAAAAIVGFGKVGAGDVKLAGAMGLALGYPGILAALLLMSAALAIYSVLGFLSGKLTMQTMIPLAPFMMLGMTATLICGILPAAIPFAAV